MVRRTRLDMIWETLDDPNSSHKAWWISQFQVGDGHCYLRYPSSHWTSSVESSDCGSGRDLFWLSVPWLNSFLIHFFICENTPKHSVRKEHCTTFSLLSFSSWLENWNLLQVLLGICLPHSFSSFKVDLSHRSGKLGRHCLCPWASTASFYWFCFSARAHNIRRGGWDDFGLLPSTLQVPEVASLLWDHSTIDWCMCQECRSGTGVVLHDGPNCANFCDFHLPVWG